MSHDIPYKFIEKDGVPYHWVDVGEGPTVVLINGMASDVWRIYPLIEVLAQEGYRIICLDHYNHSHSKGHTKEILTLQALANYHADFINARLEKVDYLVGFSLGSLFIPLLIDRLKVKPKQIVLYAPPIGEDSLHLPPWASRLKKNVQRNRINRYVFTSIVGFIVHRKRIMEAILQRYLVGPVTPSEKEDVLTVQYYLWNMQSFKQWWQIFIEILERSHAIFKENCQKLKGYQISIIYPQDDNRINSQLAEKRFKSIMPQAKLIFIPDIKHAPPGTFTKAYVESLVAQLRPYLN